MDMSQRFEKSSIQAMIDMCCNIGYQSNVASNTETQPLKMHCDQSSSKAQKLSKYKSPEDMVNALNAAEYTMTTTIFRKFKETKTSLDMHLNFSKLVPALSNALLPNLPQEISLMCDEVMPLSPFDSDNMSTELCDSTNKTENPTEILLPTTSNPLPSRDFSSDDLAKDKDDIPCDEKVSDDDNGEINRQIKRSRQDLTNLSIRVNVNNRSKTLKSTLESESTSDIVPEPNKCAEKKHTATAKKIKKQY